MDPSQEVTPSTPKTEPEKPIKVGKQNVHYAGRTVSSDPQNLHGDANPSIGKSSFSQRNYIADNTIGRRDIHILTIAEASKLLSNGTFLVRKSDVSPKYYSLIWKTLHGTISQVELKSINLETINTDIIAKIKRLGVNKYQFDKVPQPIQEVKLISSSFRSADLTPTPGLRNFLKIEPQLAERMLSNNSYLLRESSQPNFITLTIKDKEGHSIHELLDLASLPHIHERSDLEDKREITQLELKKRYIYKFKSYNSELAEVEFKENIFIMEMDCFCVRESPSKPNKYVLSIKYEKGAIVHYDLETTDLMQVNKEVKCINKFFYMDILKLEISNLIPEFEAVNSKEDALNYLFKAADIYEITNKFERKKNKDYSKLEAKYSAAKEEMRKLVSEFRNGVTELTRLYLGNGVKIQKKREIAFWKLSKHKGDKTLDKMKKLLPAAGDWAIYYGESNVNWLIMNCTGTKGPLFDYDKTSVNINPDFFKEEMLLWYNNVKYIEDWVEKELENIVGG